MRLNEPGVHALTDCDQCNHGIVPGPWPPKPCPVCNGFGVLTVARMAKLTGVDEKTVKGLWTGRVRTRVKTAQKVLSKVLELIEPKRAKQLALPMGHIRGPDDVPFILPPQFLPEPANR